MLCRFGLKNGVVIAIDDVARGLACGCTCPHCGSEFIARKGKKRAHHFAHYSSQDCGNSLETALHLLAKQIVCSAKSIKVPDGLDCGHLSISSCEIEGDVNGLRPDAILNRNREYELFVEVAVTHKVDDEKEQQLRAIGTPTMEIVLARMLSAGSVDEIRTAVLDDPTNRRWVVRPSVSSVVVSQSLAKEGQEVENKNMSQAKPRIPLGFFPSWSRNYKNNTGQANLYRKLTEEYFQIHRKWQSQDQFEKQLREILETEKKDSLHGTEKKKLEDEKIKERQELKKRYMKQKYGW